MSRGPKLAGLLVSAFTLLSCGARAETQSTSLTTYPIFWDSVPSPPPTITTWNTTVLADVCSCDLTSHLCDAGCCCDPDCTTDETGLFVGSGQPCVATTNATDRAYKCVDDGAILYFNPGSSTDSGMSVSGVSGEGISPDSGMCDASECCIALENTDGDTYSDPSELSSAAITNLSDIAQQFWPTFNRSARARRPDGYYVNGDRIPALYGNPEVPGWLKVPSADSSGDCVDSHAQYLKEFGDNNTCVRRIVGGTLSYDSLAANCTSVYAAAPYVSNVMVFAQFQTQETTTNRLTFSVTGDTSTPSYDSTTGVCSNALLKVAFVLTLNGVGLITSAAATTTLGNVTAEADGSAALEQTFSIAYTFDTDTPQVARSGMNGYISGMPIIAGTLTSSGDKSAVAQLTEGLQVIGPGVDGVCDGSRYTVVYFEQSLSSCCTLPYTQAQLEAACVDTFRPGNALTVDRIGSYGGANFRRTADWLTLDAATVPTESYASLPPALVTASQSGVYWDATTLTCYGVLADTRLDFVWTKQGAFTGPQKQLTAVTQEYERSTWRWSMDMARNSNGTNNFTQCFSASFREIPSSMSVDYMDDALTYPFHLEGWGITSKSLSFISTTLATTFLLFVCFGLVHSKNEFIRTIFQPPNL